MKSLLIVVLLFTSLSAEAKKKKHAASASGATTVFEVKDEHHAVVLRSSDISDASVVTSGKGEAAKSSLFIEFKPAATKRFREYTKSHVGKTLSIMIDGKEVESTKIIEEIEGGHMVVDPNLNAADTDALAEKINHSATRAN